VPPWWRLPRCTVERLGREIGEHDGETYGDLLGLAPAELERLRAAEVI
jgi:hypothetical protein